MQSMKYEIMQRRKTGQQIWHCLSHIFYVWTLHYQVFKTKTKLLIERTSYLDMKEDQAEMQHIPEEFYYSSHPGRLPGQYVRPAVRHAFPKV